MRFSLILLLLAFSVTATAIGAETVIVTGATSASGSTIVDVGSMVGPGGAAGAATGQGAMAQNMTQNQTQEQNRTQNGTGTGEQVRQQNQGISEQVREIVRQRENGSISVPQGFLVRVVARNRTMSVEKESFMLNETLQAHLRIQGQNRTVGFRPLQYGVEMTEGNVPVLTNETIEVSNGMLYADRLAINVLPSGIQSKVRGNISGVTLHAENGEPLYRFTARKQVRLMWIFPSEMDVETALHASTGAIKEEKGPWWSFLASEA